MSASITHDVIINAIKEKIPANSNIANILIENLHLSKEAVYRRLRGEVPFTFNEVAIIAKRFGISIDNIILGETPKSRPFHLKLTEYINPTEDDYFQMEEYIALLHSSRDELYTEMGTSSNLIPQTLHMKYDTLTKFYMFKWLYQTAGISNIKTLENIIIPERLRNLQKRHIEECLYFKSTYYVWDYLIFQYLVNDIKNFEKINYISKDDVLSLKKDLLILIDDIESLAARGRFETGNKVQFYVSHINLETAYSYMETNNYTLSLVNVFTLNSVSSLDRNTFYRLKRWMDSLKRLSTLISESGEMQRVKFFRKQREIVNSL